MSQVFKTSELCFIKLRSCVRNWFSDSSFLIGKKLSESIKSLPYESCTPVRLRRVIPEISPKSASLWLNPITLNLPSGEIKYSKETSGVNKKLEFEFAVAFAQVCNQRFLQPLTSNLFFNNAVFTAKISNVLNFFLSASFLKIEI